MKTKASQNDQFSQEERQIIGALRQRPEMMARMQSIVEIARNEGALKTADEVEDWLIQEMGATGLGRCHRLWHD